MDISIREYIKNNFKDSSVDEINESIEESINSSNEEVLPGMGVLFELLWKNSNQTLKKQILKNIQKGLK